jgi:N-acetyl-gamma-glutamyl-phosphate reductase
LLLFRNIDLNFVPWRGDFARGIFISSQLQCELSIGELNDLYSDFYKGHPFVSLSNEPIHLKQVVNTNKCMIQIEKVNNKIVIHSAIDNLLKGASGQAVQNMNLMFGLDEALGLKLKANYKVTDDATLTIYHDMAKTSSTDVDKKRTDVEFSVNF